MVQVVPAFWRAHWLQVVGAFEGCPLPSWRVPCFLSAFLLCLWCVAFEYGSISHFKGVFSAVYGVCVGLLGLGALR